MPDDESKGKRIPSLFAQRIRRAMKKVGRKNYSLIAKQSGISRHKLRAVVDGHDVPLYLSELYALDRWLSNFRLDVLVKESSVFRTLRQCGKIRFLLPLYFDDSLQRATSSTFDVLAVTEVLRRLVNAGATADPDVTYVDVHADNESLLELNEDGSAIVLVGSPRAHDLSEVALNKMFFKGKHLEGQPVPFRFVWPDWPTVRGRRRVLAGQEGAGMPDRHQDSPFVLWRPEQLASPEVLRDDQVRKLVTERNAWAIVYDDDDGHHEWHVVNNRVHADLVTPVPDRPHRVQWTGYGVLAAQWIGHQLYVVLGGISGPDTLALAKRMGRMRRFVLPPPLSNGRSAVAWYVVRSTIEGPKNPNERRCDDREIVGDPTVISGPNIWTLSAQAKEE